ncbi:aldo/keto reductase [Kocuria marina]|uniref:aldo/keto reductase n=1 Tax=Kocuria marina TaxID=223184 RepID=UPI00345FFED0
MREIAEQLGVTPNQVGLAWDLARSPQSLVISGTASPDHLRENVEAAGVNLPAEVLRELDAAA